MGEVFLGKHPLVSSSLGSFTKPEMSENSASYSLAQERYAAMGVDTEAAMAKLATIPISLHCWQAMTWAVLKTPARA